jgi:hypothetical protein
MLSDITATSEDADEWAESDDETEVERETDKGTAVDAIASPSDGAMGQSLATVDLARGYECCLQRSQCRRVNRYRSEYR